jgi:glycosyltransferase involved in cell wall biosynthesis
MKILRHIGASAAKDPADEPSPIKVCMHTLYEARDDFRVLRAATALREEGFAVAIVDVESERRPSEETISGIRMKHIFMPARFSPMRFRLWSFVKAAVVRILGILRLMQMPADIYHAHDFTALPACYVAAYLRRKPLIYDAHELTLPEQESPYWPWVRVLLARFLASALPRCAGIITVSSPIAQEICNRYHVPKVSVVRNILPYRAVQKSDRLRQHLGLPPNVRIALYQGNLQADRGLDRLIPATTYLERDIVIVLMGVAVGTTASELEALIASEAVADRIKILPPVPYSELLNWTASADIGLIVNPPEYSLSVRMSLPNKLFEYLMAGLPVLASPLEAVADTIRTYDVGRVVPSFTPKDIGMTINSMLADPVALARMRCNAQDAVKQDLCWEKEKRQLLRLYADILAIRNTAGTVREISANPDTTFPFS